MWQFALLAREMLTGDNENEISLARKPCRCLEAFDACLRTPLVGC